MLCGTAKDLGCTDIVCNGDSSCYGVKDIQMYGDPLGAVLNCNGDISCKWTRVYGINIAGILCTGDGACAFSIFDMTCIIEHGEGCPLLCVGDDSCRSLLGDPTRQAVFTISNSMGMKCAHDACVDATFHLMTNTGGSIMCTAEEACVRAEIMIDNVEMLMCKGEKACFDAHIFIKNPQEGFSVLCSGRQSCMGLDLEIMVTDPDIGFFRGIICMSPASCKGAHITINGNHELTFEELTCGAEESCRNLVFDIGPNIIFEECRCAGALTLACDNLLGVDQCMAGMNNIDCKGANGCKNKVTTITNPGNGFELFCPDPSSCENMMLNIYLDGRRRGVDHFGGVWCKAEKACNNLVVNIYNIVVGFHIDAGMVYCDTSNFCTNSTFNLIGADIDVGCSQANNCKGCTTNVEGKCTKCGTNNEPCTV
eukprot:523141_1